MRPRLASGVLVSALIRQVQAAGGHAAVLAKGDAEAGSILLVLAERGGAPRLVERMPALDGGQRWVATGPADLSGPGVLTDYVAKRRRGDPDLWAVELDVAGAAQIADGMIG
jgi:hypothetical protein